MAIQTAQGGAMPNPFPGGGAALHADAVWVINNLEYSLGLWGGPGTLVNAARARLDLQGYTATGQMNLQVQVNGQASPSTLSTALVAASVQAVLPPDPRSVPQQKEIVRKIKSALFDSLNTQEVGNPYIWLVTGTPSS